MIQWLEGQWHGKHQACKDRQHLGTDWKNEQMLKHEQRFHFAEEYVDPCQGGLSIKQRAAEVRC